MAIYKNDYERKYRGFKQNLKQLEATGQVDTASVRAAEKDIEAGVDVGLIVARHIAKWLRPPLLNRSLSDG